MGDPADQCDTRRFHTVPADAPTRIVAVVVALTAMTCWIGVTSSAAQVIGSSAIGSTRISNVPPVQSDLNVSSPAGTTTVVAYESPLPAGTSANVCPPGSGAGRWGTAAVGTGMGPVGRAEPLASVDESVQPANAIANIKKAGI